MNQLRRQANFVEAMLFFLRYRAKELPDFKESSAHSDKYTEILQRHRFLFSRHENSCPIELIIL